MKNIILALLLLTLTSCACKTHFNFVFAQRIDRIKPIQGINFPDIIEKPKETFIRV